MKPILEFISTGNELMSGMTLDTNFNWAAAQFAMNGIIPGYHVSVGDDSELLVKIFGDAASRSEVVIVSGGLGPTEDDMTTTAASRYFGVDTEFNREEFTKIEKILNSRGREPLDIHRKLASFPRGAGVIPNREGVAPGFYYIHGQTVFYFLPGVPKEFKSMLGEFVIPDVLGRLGVTYKHSFRILKSIGLGESEVSERIRKLALRNVNLSYRIYFPEVHLHILSYAETTELADQCTSRASELIADALGEYLFTSEGIDLEETVAGLLLDSGETIATAESCTGGLLASRLTDVPGSSGYFLRGVVSYSNRSKTELLGVPVELIEKHGAVSSEVVESMATGIRNHANSDIGIGISGIAGPSGGTKEKPVGTVFIGVDSKKRGVFSKSYLFHGTRSEIKLITTSYALNIIRNVVINIV